MKRLLPLACLALLASGSARAATAPTPAPAAEHPALSPTRDAILAYHLAPATGEAIDVRLIMRAGGKALRLDLPDGSFILAFPPVHEVTIVVPPQKTTADLEWDAGPQGLFLLDDRMRFTRRADAVVAGQKCTVWDAVMDQDHRTVCVTPDGLVLRNQSQDPRGRRNLLEAFIVKYDSVPNEAFAIPPGFESVSPPGQRGRPSAVPPAVSAPEPPK